MINEINEASEDLKSEVVSAFELNPWLRKNDVMVIAIIPLPSSHSLMLVVYTDREVEEEKHIRGFGD